MRTQRRFALLNKYNYNLTHEEVTSGEREKGQEGQWVLKGEGVLDCQEGHTKNQRVHACAWSVDAEHDKVAHVLVADAVSSEKTVMISPENNLLAQFAEVASVKEVVGIHFVRAVGWTHRNRCVIGTLSRIFDSHYVIPQCIKHQEEKNSCVKGCRAPQRCVRIGEDRWDEEEEM